MRPLVLTVALVVAAAAAFVPQEAGCHQSTLRHLTRRARVLAGVSGASISLGPGGGVANQCKLYDTCTIKVGIVDPLDLLPSLSFWQTRPAGRTAEKKTSRAMLGPLKTDDTNGSGPLNVRSFGAEGDGVTDDTDAIQKAIDQAQQVSALGTSSCHHVPYEDASCALSRPVYFPAGLYVVKSSLRIAVANRRMSPGRLSLRIYGDGMHQSAVVAGAAMDAVLRFEGHQPPRGWGKGGNTTSGHAVENMRFDAAGLANYSVAATAITRSQFRSTYFTGARIAGLLLGYGWINTVNGCYFLKNLIGVYLDNAVNSVNVVDGNFETNYGARVIVNCGAAVRLEGNEFESIGGPAIIANGVSALTVRSNYFEANNLGGPPENASLANQEIRYFDLVTGRQVQVCTDVLLNGNSKWGPERSEGTSSLVAPGPDGRLILGPIYLSNVDPCTGVVVAANSHAPYWVNDFCPGMTFAGAFCAGCDGLQASSSHCGGCIKAGGSAPDRICEAVASGPAPNANASLAEMLIQLNTGDFSLPARHGSYKSDDLEKESARLAQKSDDNPVSLALNVSQLFLDGSLLRTSHGLSIRIHRPVIDAQPVIVQEYAWEGTSLNAYNSLVELPNGTIYLYYDAMNFTWNPPAINYRYTLLATSADDEGKVFTKPSLGIFAHDASTGNTSNNIIMPDRRITSGWSPGTVWIDEKPGIPKNEKFKMIALYYWNCPSLAQHHGACTYTFGSPDGIHNWTRLGENASYIGSDTQDVAMWDASIAKYVAFRRNHCGPRCENTSATLCVEYSPAQETSHNLTTCSYECTGGKCENCKGFKNLTCASSSECPPGPGGCHRSAHSGGQLFCEDGICQTKDHAAAACWKPVESEPYCGKAMESVRYVGRCVADTLTSFPQLEEDCPSVISFDNDDKPSTDVYTSQVMRYEKTWLAFPAFFTHYPSPPNWPLAEDGVWDTRIMHSRDGIQWHYLGDERFAFGLDRSAFLAKGPMGGLPIPNEMEVPSQDPETWNSGMTAVVRGYVVRGNKIIMYAWGTRARHGQAAAGKANGAGGEIRRMTLRLDGWASLATDSAKWSGGTAASVPISVPRGTNCLQVNAQTGVAGRLAIGLASTAGQDLPGLSLNTSIQFVGDSVNHVMAWDNHGRNLDHLAGSTVVIKLLLSDAQLYSFAFSSCTAAGFSSKIADETTQTTADAKTGENGNDVRPQDAPIKTYDSAIVASMLEYPSSAELPLTTKPSFHSIQLAKVSKTNKTRCTCANDTSALSPYLLTSVVATNETQSACCARCTVSMGCLFVVYYHDGGKGHCHLRGGTFMYMQRENAPRVSTCWHGNKPPRPPPFVPFWRNDHENERVAAAWNEMVLAQETLNGKPPPVNLTWSVARGDPMPIFQKNGQACLFGMDEVVLAGGIQWIGQFGPFNFTSQPCQDVQNGATAKCCGCNYAISYSISSGRWSYLPQPPFFYRRTQGTCDTDNLYLVGGTGGQLAPGAKPFQKVVSFNRFSRTWSSLPDFPDFRWLGTAAVLEHSTTGADTTNLAGARWLLMGFGTTCLKGMEDSMLTNDDLRWPPPPPFSGKCTLKQDNSNLPAYRLQLGNTSAGWQPIAPFSGPPGTRLGLSSIGLGANWYVFGGRVELPERLKEAWLVASSVPAGAGFAQAATDGVGGTLVHSDAYKYNIIENKWTRLPNMPAANDGGSTPVIIDRRYILLLGSSQQVTARFGKSKGKGSPTAMTDAWSGWGDDVLCFDTVTDNWTRPGVLLYGVKTAGVIFNSTHVFMFGGEPTTALNGNTENVVQVAEVRRNKAVSSLKTAADTSDHTYTPSLWSSTRPLSLKHDDHQPTLLHLGSNSDDSSDGAPHCTVTIDLRLPRRAAPVSGRVAGILSGINNTQPGVALVKPLGLTMWRGPQAGWLWPNRSACNGDFPFSKVNGRHTCCTPDSCEPAFSQAAEIHRLGMRQQYILPALHYGCGACEWFSYNRNDSRHNCTLPGGPNDPDMSEWIYTVKAAAAGALRAAAIAGSKNEVYFDVWKCVYTACSQ